jgi:hypothetical protein
MIGFQCTPIVFDEESKKYQKLGIKDGAKAIPPSAASVLSPAETNIKQLSNRACQSTQSNFDKFIMDKRTEFSYLERDLSEYKNDLYMLNDDGVLNNDVEHELVSRKEQLITSQSELLLKEANYRKFRALNKIDREPRSIKSKKNSLFVILFLVLSETLMNAYFFANEHGLVGGIIVAFCVAVMTMGVGVVAGFLWRYKNEIRMELKIAGWGVFILWIMFSLYFVALLSAYRGLLPMQLVASEPEIYAMAAKEALSIFIFEYKFHEIQGIVQFVFGVLFSVAAFCKGYTLDDKYPGFGELHRKLKSTEEDFSAARGDALTKLGCFINERKAKLNTLKTTASIKIVMIDKNIASIENTIKTIKQYSVSTQRDYHALLKTYRDANISVRPVPQPMYFQEYQALDHEFDVSDAEACLMEMQQLKSEFESLRAEHDDLIMEKITQLKDDAKIVLARGFSDYLFEIKTAAQEKINVRQVGYIRHKEQELV